MFGFRYPALMIILETLNLADAERKLCEEALSRAGSIVEAAEMLGITRHALKRRIVKYRIDWPSPYAPPATTSGRQLSVAS